jgi:peptidoglycan/xylan/chitin deacetylase (PgdA/CDA1 family)
MINRIINKTKRIGNELIFNVFPKNTGFFKERKNIIFMYHGVSLQTNTDFNSRHISIRHFEKQISFLKKHCNVISLSDFYRGNFSKNKPNVSITFDDGYLNNYLNAKPIIEKYQVPVTFFITGINKTTDTILWADFINIITFLNKNDLFIQSERYVNKNGKFYNKNGETIEHIIKTKYPSYEFKTKIYKDLGHLSWFKEESKYFEYWKLMNDYQIKECSMSSCIEIGSHGYFHNNLGNMPVSEAINELIMSKKYLEDITQKEIYSLAYPDGSYTRELIDEAFKIGFTIQLAADNFLFENDYTDNRIRKRKGVYSCDSPMNQLFL